jgi:hypothetical protein
MDLGELATRRPYEALLADLRNPSTRRPKDSGRSSRDRRAVEPFLQHVRSRQVGLMVELARADADLGYEPQPVIDQLRPAKAVARAFFRELDRLIRLADLDSPPRKPRKASGDDAFLSEVLRWLRDMDSTPKTDRVPLESRLESLRPRTFDVQLLLRAVGPVLGLMVARSVGRLRSEAVEESRVHSLAKHFSEETPPTMHQRIWARRFVIAGGIRLDELSGIPREY